MTEFGYHGTLPPDDTAGVGGQYIRGIVAAGVVGYLDRIIAYLNLSGSGRAKGILAKRSDGSIVAISDELTDPGNDEWKEFVFSPRPATEAIDYELLVITHPDTGALWRFDNVAGTFLYQDAGNYASPADPVVINSGSGALYFIYGVVTEDSGVSESKMLERGPLRGVMRGISRGMNG